jgi:hypothetical protein
MNESEAIAQLVGVLSNLKPGNQLKHYISHVRFPLFKNIEPHTRIDFPFPFTALVGANGSGKSSVLHALWGTPLGYSTSRFWFATDLDPITDAKREPQRYVYGHWNDSFGGIVETRKVCPQCMRPIGALRIAIDETGLDEDIVMRGRRDRQTVESSPRPRDVWRQSMHQRVQD